MTNGKTIRSARASVVAGCAMFIALASHAVALRAADASPGLIDVQTTVLLEGETKHNLELERGRTSRIGELEPELRFRATLFRGKPLWGVLGVELLQKIETERGEPTARENRFNVAHAYLATDELLPDTRVRLGRWLQRDEREWLFDENIDGLHLHYEKERIEGEFFVARVGHWRRDLLNRRSGRGDPINQVATIGRYELGKDWQIGAYLLRQHEIERADTYRTFSGLRSHRRVDEGLRHWFELGHVGGRHEGRRIDGRVIDLGATYVLATKPANLRFTLGFAHATGDDRNTDAVDRAYRQTDLHSNEATYGGLVKFLIYGETIDPDLANLQIFSAGVGVDIGRTSLDLIYHDYRQPVIGRLRGTDLDPEEDLRDRRDLGNALDLVFGWRPNDDMRLALALGVMRPSARFRADDDDDAPRSSHAWSARMELRMYF